MENADAILDRIREQATDRNVRITRHAHEEMVDERCSLDDVVQALASPISQLLENYPDHRRGACCLVYGPTEAGRPVHVVCTTGQSPLIIVTVYEPVPPKWVSPTQRGP